MSFEAVNGSCEQAQVNIDALSSWSENQRSEEQNLGCNYQPVLSDKCRVEITNCVPDQVRQYQSTNPVVKGPNCWNLALVMRGLVPSLRWSSPEEMSFFMSSSLCRPLEPNEQRKAGDIIAIRENDFKNGGDVVENHGLIYISEDLVYSKNDLTHTAPYAIQSFDEVMRRYSVSEEESCRTNRSDASCWLDTSFYRCEESLDEYLLSNPPSFALESALENLGQFETCMEQKLFSQFQFSDEGFSNLEDSVAILIHFLNESKSNSSALGENDRFVLGVVQLRLDAIKGQFSIARDPLLEDRMNHLARALEQASEEITDQ